MKAFAFGGRAKWKDYVDMFFLLKHKLHLTQITNNAENIFGEAFNKKLFHQQLSYFNDVDYSEPVTFLSENPPTEQEIKDFLTEQALTEF